MEIIGNTIRINRGNHLLFDFQIESGDEIYEFVENDIIRFSIYEAKGLNKEPILQKEFPTTIGSDTVTIDIPKEEMKIGEMLNKPKTYWYEITLNEETVLGYDDDGAKQLILDPEGSDLVDTDTEDNG